MVILILLCLLLSVCTFVLVYVPAMVYGLGLNPITFKSIHSLDPDPTPVNPDNGGGGGNNGNNGDDGGGNGEPVVAKPTEKSDLVGTVGKEKWFKVDATPTVLDKKSTPKVYATYFASRNYGSKSVPWTIIGRQVVIPLYKDTYLGLHSRYSLIAYDPAKIPGNLNTVTQQMVAKGALLFSVDLSVDDQYVRSANGPDSEFGLIFHTDTPFDIGTDTDVTFDAGDTNIEILYLSQRFVIQAIVDTGLSTTTISDPFLLYVDHVQLSLLKNTVVMDKQSKAILPPEDSYSANKNYYYVNNLRNFIKLYGNPLYLSKSGYIKGTDIMIAPGDDPTDPPTQYMYVSNCGFMVSDMEFNYRKMAVMLTDIDKDIPCYYGHAPAYDKDGNVVTNLARNKFTLLKAKKE